MSKRKRDYLFKRPNSQHWRVRFQMGGRSVEQSLGTPDRAHAEIIALPLIAEHKAKLLEARPRLERSWQPQYEPGREHVGPDGSRIIATERELFHLDATGRITGKSDTIEKKIGWLNAMVNLAIKEGRLKFNPFASVVPKRDDKQRRLPLSDADVKECKRNLDKLSESDQMLIRLLGSTGMRLSEAFGIEGEEREKGCRYVIVGKKTEQSLRRVPLPTAVLPTLPKTITGPLFL